MYTWLVCSFHLKEGTPSEVIEVLKHMTGLRWSASLRDDLPLPHVPDHPFFLTDMWSDMLRYEHNLFDGANPHCTFAVDQASGLWHLDADSAFKNYCDEVDLFFNWITPWVVSGDNGLVGHSLFSERQGEYEPDRYYIRDGVLSVLPGAAIPWNAQ